MQREQFGEYALWYQGLHKLVKRQLHVGCVCGGGGGGVVVMVHSNREKSLRHVAMVAKFVDLNKRSPASMAEKKNENTFLCRIALRNKTVTHTFLPAVSVKADCWDPETLPPW